MSEARKRRPRDPEGTREVILEAARDLLSRHGPEALSLSEVAHLAGVNRGTAYQHFETREKLIQATVTWVSDKLFRAAFGDPETAHERRAELPLDGMAEMTELLSEFAMENPELCRAWLLQVLASSNPAEDPFWREYEGSLKRFAATDLAQPGVDGEVLSVLMLAGTFLWPVWARAHAKDETERKALAQRFARECLRLSMYGSLKSEKFPEIAQRLAADERVEAGV